MSAPNGVTEPIEESWKQLTALVESLGPDDLTLKGPDGWAVKDHLAHIAAWEASLIGLLEGADRATAMGLAANGDEETDQLNDEIWHLHRDKSPEEALTYFRDTHVALMRVLGKLSDDDLQRPYNDYQPNDPRDPDDNRPALDWVAGNTWEHYDEHREWVVQLIKDSRAAS